MRVRPQRTELLDAARGLYQAVRPGELLARAEGSSAHDAAVGGLSNLAELLVGAGIPSYDEFIWQALPAEVRGRTASEQGGYPSRPDAVGPLADLLRAAGRLHAGLLTWVGELDRLADLAEALVAGGARLRASVDQSQASSDEFSTVVMEHDGFSPILASVTLWADMTREVDGLLSGLTHRLADLRSSAAQTRFRIALSALQSETVGQFACELIDGLPGSEAARPAIGQLVQAVREGASGAAAAMDANAALAAQVGDEVQGLAELIGVPTTLLGSFEAMAAGRSNAAVEALLPKVGTVIERSQADADALLALAEQCRGVRHLETAPVLAELDSIEALAPTAG